LPVIDKRYSQSIADLRDLMRRSNTATLFSERLEDYLWQSDVDDDEAGGAATAAPVAPPQPARRSSDTTDSTTAMPPPETALDRPAIRSPVQVHHAAPRLAPPLSVVVRPSGLADRTSPTADRSPAHAATTRHRSNPYDLVRANQHVAAAQSTIDPIVDYQDDWRSYRVALLKDMCWWQWNNGIIDLRPLFRAKSSATAGTQLGLGFDACELVLRRHACEFKVGMARLLGSRWELYQSSPATWTPSHLFIVMHVRGRDAVGFAEAGLIGMLHACGDYDNGLNVNHLNNDRGGSGPRHECELDDWFWVYLATKSVS